MDFFRWLGFFLAAASIPAVLLLILKLVPFTRNRHGLTYGLTGTLGVLFVLLPIGNQPFGTVNIGSALIMAALWIWGYRRASRTQPK